jgi:hypothetical protein
VIYHLLGKGGGNIIDQPSPEGRSNFFRGDSLEAPVIGLMGLGVPPAAFSAGRLPPVFCQPDYRMHHT